MAVTTTLGSNILVIEVRRNPTGGTVTVITLSSGWKMIQVLAHRGDAIMATFTRPQHLEVIHNHHWIPQVSAVAILADIGAADMVKTLTSCGNAIVAVTTTLGSNILVIKIRRDPASAAVAIIALCRCR